MKRYTVLGFTAIAGLLLFVLPTMPQQGGKVLLIVRDTKLADPPDLEWAITKEAGVMKEMLQKAGYVVETASPTGESWGTSTVALKPERKLADVKVADYKGFVIPCLGIGSMALDPDLAAVIKSAVKNGKPIAAQLGGVAMLAKAGVLSGKKYAVAGDATVPELGDGIYSGSGVVKDGKIITSGICPVAARHFRGAQDGTPKLMEALIAELK
jgi:putative intracellular protease/amidase